MMKYLGLTIALCVSVMLSSCGGESPDVLPVGGKNKTDIALEPTLYGAWKADGKNYSTYLILWEDNTCYYSGYGRSRGTWSYNESEKKIITDMTEYNGASILYTVEYMTTSSLVVKTATGDSKTFYRRALKVGDYVKDGEYEGIVYTGKPFDSENPENSYTNEAYLLTFEESKEIFAVSEEAMMKIPQGNKDYYYYKEEAKLGLVGGMQTKPDYPVTDWVSKYDKSYRVPDRYEMDKIMANIDEIEATLKRIGKSGMSFKDKTYMSETISFSISRINVERQSCYGIYTNTKHHESEYTKPQPVRLIRKYVYNH